MTFDIQKMITTVLDNNPTNRKIPSLLTEIRGQRSEIRNAWTEIVLKLEQLMSF